MKTFSIKTAAPFLFLSFFALWLILLPFFSCSKLKKTREFDLDYEGEIILPSSAKLDLPFTTSSPDIPSHSEMYFEINDTRKDHIKEIKAKSLLLTITSPSKGDFSFLKSIEISIAAEGLPEAKTAWKYTIPDSIGNTLELETGTTDLKEYIKADRFKLIVSTVTDELMTAEYRIKPSVVFHVKADLFKQ